MPPYSLKVLHPSLVDTLLEIRNVALGKIRVPLWYRCGLSDVRPFASYEPICLSGCTLWLTLDHCGSHVPRMPLFSSVLDRAGPSPHKGGDREQLRDLWTASWFDLD